MMDYVHLLILLALVQFIFFTARTGFARNKYAVHAPATTGNETFERIFRVQQNTMEQLVLFIPGMLAFAHYVSHSWALLPGVLYLVGRQVYSHQYVADPKQRELGMTLSLAANIALVAGALVGLALQLV
ncbi:MAG TPA: MAPEG family protein [Xanthomonadales bacterium]|nr:MAPEG family protein [Xanthomonadales bacterium]